MTNSIDDLHVYLRSIAEGERTSLSVLAGLVHDGAQILDLGCGSGALGQYLKETRHCISDGVTLSQAEAEHARPHYRRVEVADLESVNLAALFGSQRYDYIVCADVLEHLRRPETILQQCRDLLQPQGQLLISVPNATYSGLLAELMEGEFRYRDEGLLDRTHLRFFTRRSLVRFLCEQRWQLDVVDTVTRELPESEFHVAFDLLPPQVARHLLSAPDALTYQFIGAARPVDFVPRAEHLEASAEPAHARFTAQLYLGYAGHYAEDDKLSRSGAIGVERQTLQFPLPVRAEPLTQLRLDPADRPGFLHLYSLRLRDAAQNVLWEWQAESGTRALMAQAPHQQIAWEAPLPPSSAASLVMLTGTDPWLQLPIPVEAMAPTSTSSCVLEVELGWPMSADYLGLAGQLHRFGERVDELQAQAKQARDTIGAQRHEIDQAHTRAQLADHYCETLARQKAALELKAQRLDRDYAALASHLQSIENSTVFRATRPLVHTKMRLDRLLGRVPASTAQATRQAQPLTPTDHPVDIIVPVYRGLADTERCVNSVLASPCQRPWRLIVINDASPEPEVTEWLRARAAQDGRITLLENPENLGFVGTVNRGMALSTSNDVLLLNSDTEVTNDWLDRIQRAAYSDQKVASVTPFSNNATICSYPRFCEDNVLPPGYDTARLDQLCAATNPGVVVDVPTGVGFCMYIRRDCLNAVGLFDTANFGKGYGEENDFCQRAANAGWRNLHALDTFVLHTGGVSFGESKSPRERAAMETLRRLHPGYEAAVTRFLMEDPGQPFRLALDAARIQQARRPVVLAVVHDRAGGTLRHVLELATELQDQAVFLTLKPAANRSVRLQIASETEGFELAFRLEDQYAELLDVLRDLGVRHVHYHHLLGHDPMVADLPAHLGVSYDFTAHDFYAYCSHITLSGTTNQYVASEVPGVCGCCHPSDPSPQGMGTLADWRHWNQYFLNMARHVFAPSQDTARRIRDFAPSARVRAVPHTDLVGLALPQPQRPRALKAGETLKIAVLGALSGIKGADMMESVAIQAAKRGVPVEFHLLGYGYRHLQTQPRAALTVHGEYADRDLPRLLSWLQPDVVWFPAQWPETYSYTLSAVLQAGLPVVVPNIGAFSERIQDRAWSWVHAWDANSNEWLDFFQELRDQHFASDVPAPLAPSTAVAPPSDWSYREDYLQSVAAADLSERTALDSGRLKSFRVQRTGAVAARSAALRTLVYLRSHPALRGVARLVPAKLQRQVKSWLQR